MADRYSVTVRTAQRDVEKGILPPPDLYLGPLPIWWEQTLDRHDRVLAKLPRPAHPRLIVGAAPKQPRTKKTEAA